MSDIDDPAIGRPNDRASGMAALVRTAVGQTTAALLDPETAAADGLTDADRALHRLLEELDEDAGAAQAAGPRATVAGAHLGNDFESLAELVRKLAWLAWARREKGPLPERVLPQLKAMRGGVLTMFAMAGAALTTSIPADLSAGREVVEDQQRLLYDELLSGAEQVTADDAVATVLLACHLQQCAQHAASLARHAALLAAPAGFGA